MAVRAQAAVAAARAQMAQDLEGDGDGDGLGMSGSGATEHAEGEQKRSWRDVPAFQLWAGGGIRGGGGEGNEGSAASDAGESGLDVEEPLAVPAWEVSRVW